MDNRYSAHKANRKHYRGKAGTKNLQRETAGTELTVSERRTQNVYGEKTRTQNLRHDTVGTKSTVQNGRRIFTLQDDRRIHTAQHGCRTRTEQDEPTKLPNLMAT